MSEFDRRQFLAIVGATATFAGASAFAQGQSGLEFGPEEPFSFDLLRDMARDASAKPYVAPANPAPEVLQQIDYDAHGKIHFRVEDALWGGKPELRLFPVTFFHLGRYFQKPVRMYALETGKAREIVYRDNYFDMPSDSVARRLPRGSGFAGFRFQEASNGDLDWKTNDWVAFLGASYFRAIGELFQYGLSARGITIDVANPQGPEEFPDFTHIWLEEAKNDAEGATVYALLQGPSVAGAYRFVMKRGKAVIMDIEKHLFLRKPIARFGIAPLTSMYWFSETAKPKAADWRPEVHDSDGLALWTGADERIWRPLNNPSRTTASAFSDKGPKGFGLLQRDRVFANYMDGVHYERRPSVWVEPLDNWGDGSVQLIEIPTDDEIHDNIVAQWVPTEPTRAGQAVSFRYRLHWVADEPYPPTLARCVATRLGNGGQPGTARPKGVRKFMIEFLGDTLKNIPFGIKPEPILWASRGAFSYILTEAVPDDTPGHWRAQFDLTTEGAEPVEIRAFLKLGDKVLTETWLFQYHPF